MLPLLFCGGFAPLLPLYRICLPPLPTPPPLSTSQRSVNSPATTTQQQRHLSKHSSAAKQQQLATADDSLRRSIAGPVAMAERDESDATVAGRGYHINCGRKMRRGRAATNDRPSTDVAARESHIGCLALPAATAQEPARRVVGDMLAVAATSAAAADARGGARRHCCLLFCTKSVDKLSARNNESEIFRRFR